ncbi:MAG: dTDP-4-dehydrorhamnose 3,5-epimerase [Flavobacteriaceae bacterium]
MEVVESPLKDCFYLKPSVFQDKRGLFSETYNKGQFEEILGREIHFVQDNQSLSKYGVLRGLHFQKGAMAQAKLVRVAFGKVLDIVVDLRKDSPSFGKHFSLELSAQNGLQLFVPRGFAHGFVTLSEESVFCYKCDNYYDKTSEGGIIYNDATLHLDWHLSEEELIVSEKDLALPTFKEAIQ